MSRRRANLTSIPISPEADRHRRAALYLVMMLIRLGCFALCILLQGWWILVFGLGAVFLPYFAVVVANATDGRSKRVERPGTIVRYQDSSGKTQFLSDESKQE